MRFVTEWLVCEAGCHDDVLIHRRRIFLMKFLHVSRSPNLRVDFQKIMFIVNAAIRSRRREPKVKRGGPYLLLIRSPEHCIFERRQRKNLMNVLPLFHAFFSCGIGFHSRETKLGLDYQQIICPCDGNLSEEGRCSRLQYFFFYLNGSYPYIQENTW